ncbi:MAG: hypothetical protein OHM77_09375 [Candidatus Nitricoxidivorans perseverans]|uniref:Uncharacterized protein n=1 Tax=Candidatus Nitricoxidivorans perseverans TaxID=2975601 RepID=A0AA49FJZ5_9PROT|nr:MAG: hypothetical protein OHM77_09375 [Candidatus Nitricoxidivorans perseverans]
MALAMPPTSADQPPAFTSVGECRAWLEGTPLSNTIQAQALLLRQLNLLNRFHLPAAERLAILELLREPLISVQEESIRKFAGKPLPLTPPEQAAFDSCRTLWHALTGGYLRCLESCLAGDAVIRPRAAQVIERALATLAASQLDAYRGGRQPDADHWQVVHQLYATAEQIAVTEQAVEDVPRLGRNRGNPRSAYVETLLLHAASPYELPLRQLAWVARWANRFAMKVAVLAAPPTPSTQAIPLCVDLSADEPASYRPRAGESARWLETAGLRRSLKKRLVLLEQGKTPAELHLGEDCLQPACDHLLKQVYLRWCKGGAVRCHERRPVGGGCAFICGVEAAHYYLSERKPFRQPGHADMDMLRREREEIATFGRVSTRHQDDFSRQQGYRLEEWRLEEEWRMHDESATGLHATRPLKQAGARVGAGLLAAVRPGDAQGLLLGCVRWAMVGKGEILHAGIHIFPGRPEPVAIRNTGLAAVNEKYHQAFLLPAIAALDEPASVIIPSGWFKLGRVLEVFTDQGRQIRLTRLVDRGGDFDRAFYEAAGG